MAVGPPQLGKEALLRASLYHMLSALGFSFSISKLCIFMALLLGLHLGILILEPKLDLQKF